MSYIKHKAEESMEDYLEAIFILGKKLENVRSIDIANHLHYSKPSVSIAMKNLRNNGFIETSSAGYITLTAKGLSLASTTYERHAFFEKLLVSLGVNAEQAAADACKLEHDLSEDSFLALKKFAEARK